MTVTEILNSIKNKKYFPVYLLVGKEKYFHDQVINSFSKQLFLDSSSRSLNRIILYGSENSLPEVVNASLSYPMLSEYKMVVVREFSKIKTADAEIFLKYLENPQKSNILLLSADDLPRNSFFKKVNELSQYVDCKSLPDYKIINWLKEYIAGRNIKMGNQAISMLTEYTGSSLLNIEHELNKILEYKSESSEITVEDVITITGMSREYNVFTLQKALSDKDLKNSFLIAKNLLETGENINLIISILFSFFKKVLIAGKLRMAGINTREILSQMKLNDFQGRDIFATLNKFNMQSLEKSVKLLHETDQNIKSTAQNDWIVLQKLCYNICRQ